MYLGISGSTFDEMRSSGQVEPPRLIKGRKTSAISIWHSMRCRAKMIYCQARRGTTIEGPNMAKLPYVKEYTDDCGIRRRYFRRKGFKGGALPGRFA